MEESQAKTKKPIFKRWWFWAIVVVIIIAAASSGGKKDTTQQASTQQAAQQQQAPVELAKSGISSNVTIEVVGIDTKSTLGNNQFSIAEAKGIFKVVKLKVTNNQKDAITIDNNSFKLIDDQGREFTYSTDGSMAIASSMSGDKNTFTYVKINPGISAEGSVPFDVPKDAKGFKLKARGGLTGTEITLKVE